MESRIKGQYLPPKPAALYLVEYKKGKKNVVVDALSKREDREEDTEKSAGENPTSIKDGKRAEGELVG